MTTVDLGIPAGPGRLRQMTPGEVQALDPYMATVIGYRKSGLSLNNIVGCPLDCGYCVRHFWDNYDQKIPKLIVPTAAAVTMLLEHPGFEPHVTPVQLYNKATDPFLPGVKPHLFHILHALDDLGHTNHVLVITRFKVTEADIAELETLRHVRVTLLFTYSGITDPRIELVAKSDITATSIPPLWLRRRVLGSGANCVIDLAWLAGAFRRLASL